MAPTRIEQAKQAGTEVCTGCLDTNHGGCTKIDPVLKAQAGDYLKAWGLSDGDTVYKESLALAMVAVEAIVETGHNPADIKNNKVRFAKMMEAGESPYFKDGVCTHLPSAPAAAPRKGLFQRLKPW
jgi:hypothetical protein